MNQNNQRKKKKIKENKEDDSQKIEKTSFEHIVRSEVKAWIKKNAKKLSSLAIVNAIKDMNEKKKQEPNI